VLRGEPRVIFIRASAPARTAGSPGILELGVRLGAASDRALATLASNCANDTTGLLVAGDVKTPLPSSLCTMVGVTVTAGSLVGVSETRRVPVRLAALIDPVASAISIGLRLANDIKLILEISGPSAVVLESADNTSAGAARAASDTTSDVERLGIDLGVRFRLGLLEVILSLAACPIPNCSILDAAVTASASTSDC
jgi:hypothetical protein